MYSLLECSKFILITNIAGIDITLLERILCSTLPDVGNHEIHDHTKSFFILTELLYISSTGQVGLGG